MPDIGGTHVIFTNFVEKPKAMYNKLTRGELRIIEETKREGELARAEQGPGKQNNLGRKPVRAVLSLLALVLIFCLMAFVAWLVFNSFS